MNNPDIDARIATEIMGEPKPDEFLASWEETFACYLCDIPVYSPKGNWVVVHHYENDDIQEWRPLAFSSDPAACKKLKTRITKLGFDIQIELPHIGGCVVSLFPITGKTPYYVVDTEELALCIAILDVHRITPAQPHLHPAQEKFLEQLDEKAGQDGWTVGAGRHS